MPEIYWWAMGAVAALWIGGAVMVWLNDRLGNPARQGGSDRFEGGP